MTWRFWTMVPLSNEEENLVRLLLLLKGLSPRAVRTFFDKEFPPTYLPSTLNTNYDPLNDLYKKRILNHVQWTLLFPRNSMCFKWKLIVLFCNRINNKVCLYCEIWQQMYKRLFGICFLMIFFVIGNIINRCSIPKSLKINLNTNNYLMMDYSIN